MRDSLLASTSALNEPGTWVTSHTLHSMSRSLTLANVSPTSTRVVPANSFTVRVTCRPVTAGSGGLVSVISPTCPVCLTISPVHFPPSSSEPTGSPGPPHSDCGAGQTL